MVFFGGFSAKLGHFPGFSLHIINNAVRISSYDERGGGHYIFCVVFLYLFAERISEATMSGVGDIRFSAWFFYIYTPKGSAKLRWAGRGSGDIV
jgi:hypothetical protein